jgi:hypothetical protein
VLFVPGADSTRTSRLYDEIKQINSRYRNLLTEHNRNLRRLREQRKVEGRAEYMRAAVAAKQEAYAGSEEALIRIDELIDQSIEQEREPNDELRRQQLDLEGSFRAYEGIQ